MTSTSATSMIGVTLTLVMSVGNSRSRRSVSHVTSPPRRCRAAPQSLASSSTSTNAPCDTPSRAAHDDPPRRARLRAAARARPRARARGDDDARFTRTLSVRQHVELDALVALRLGGGLSPLAPRAADRDARLEGQRRGHQQDHDQHQRDVDERRHVDVEDAVAASCARASSWPPTPSGVLRHAARASARRGRAAPRRRGCRARSSSAEPQACARGSRPPSA